MATLTPNYADYNVGIFINGNSDELKTFKNFIENSPKVTKVDAPHPTIYVGYLVVAAGLAKSVHSLNATTEYVWTRNAEIVYYGSHKDVSRYSYMTMYIGSTFYPYVSIFKDIFKALNLNSLHLEYSIENHDIHLYQISTSEYSRTGDIYYVEEEGYSGMFCSETKLKRLLKRELKTDENSFTILLGKGLELAKRDHDWIKIFQASFINTDLDLLTGEEAIAQMNDPREWIDGRYFDCHVEFLDRSYWYQYSSTSFDVDCENEDWRLELLELWETFRKENNLPKRCVLDAWATI